MRPKARGRILVVLDRQRVRGRLAGPLDREPAVVEDEPARLIRDREREAPAAVAGFEVDPVAAAGRGNERKVGPVRLVPLKTLTPS